MDLFSLIMTLVVIGIILWLINRFIPMEPNVKQVLNVAVIIVIVLWLLRVFLGPGVGNIRVGR